MFNLLVKLFVKDYKNTDNPSVRESYGKLSGIVGIFLNILLSASKITVGALTGAISILSDGINNLSDASSSVITLIGFKLSGKKPDKKHPYGHGRIEYFAGLAISTIIVFIAITLLKDSVNKIINGETIDMSYDFMFFVVVGVLVFSILVKLFMALFNTYLGKKIHSLTLSATSLDSISDCVTTFVVLVCTFLSVYIKNVPLDGIAGIIVSVFIAFTGVKSIKDLISPLLGEAPSAEMVHELKEFVINYSKDVVGVHDIMFHDYGAGRKLVVLHVEVPAEGNIMELHDMIDNIEKDIEQKFNCISTIHMDPVITTSERLKEIKKVCREIVKGIDERFDIHDFRMNEGSTHANVIFDLVVDRESNVSFEEVNRIVTEKMKQYDDKLNLVINVEYDTI